ncbi:MAG: hypothetical protein AAGK37_05585 [Pseudomonadota bacterium]
MLLYRRRAHADRSGNVAEPDGSGPIYAPFFGSGAADFGQAVICTGTITHAPRMFRLDAYHMIETGRVFPVCGNTWRMLTETRFAPQIELIGDFSTHHGIFEGCGMVVPFDRNVAGASSGGC